MGIAEILVMLPGPFEDAFAHPFEEALHEIWLQLA